MRYDSLHIYICGPPVCRTTTLLKAAGCGILVYKGLLFLGAGAVGDFECSHPANNSFSIFISESPTSSIGLLSSSCLKARNEQ